MIEKVSKDVSNKAKLLGAGAVMLAALLWSLDGVFIRPKLYALPAGLVVFLEHFLGFLVLSPFIFFGRARIRALELKDWGAVAWVSVFGGLIGTLFITKAFFAAVNGEVTFATVVILQKLQPVFALILARIVLGEKLKKSFYFWAGLAIAAAYFLTFGKLVNPREIMITHQAALFAVIAAFAFGSSTVYGKKIVNRLDFGSTSALRFGLTTILAGAYVVVTGGFGGVPLITPEQMKLFAIIVFTSGAAAMFIYYYGLKKISASAATIFELTWPLSAVALDFILNRNILNPVQIGASLLLLVCFFKIVRR
ncbi:MAG: DMT family transporter [Patescibacteria group bacterium]|jgi:drug/metabolite transporter (DMT)-like permease